MNYYLRETEWPSFRKRILQDLLIILVCFFFLFRLSAPLSHFPSPGSTAWAMGVILQLSPWLLLRSPDCTASERSTGDRCCPWPCHNLSCPFLPTDCQTLWGLWHRFAYRTLCLHAPFNTIPHLLHLHVFLPKPVPWTRLVFLPFLHVTCYLLGLSWLWDTSYFTARLPSLPWHVSWSLSALKSLPTSSNSTEKQKACLLSIARLLGTPLW